MGGPQLRGRDHPVPAAGPGRRPLLDPHRGVRDRCPGHQAGPGGDHAGDPEPVRRAPGQPGRPRRHPHRRRRGDRGHPGGQDDAQGRDRADPGGAPAARDLRREGQGGARHLAEGPARRVRQGHRRHRVPARGRRRAARRGEPAGPRVRRPEAQDQGGRQARRPARQQGRHRQDPADRGHALPVRRHPGRHRAEPARRAGPDEHRPGAGDAPRLGGTRRMGRSGGRGAGCRLRPGAPVRRSAHQRGHAGLRRDPRGRARRAPGAHPPERGRRQARRRERQGASCSTGAPASRIRCRSASATCTSSSCCTWWTTRSTPVPPARTR